MFFNLHRIRGVMTDATIRTKTAFRKNDPPTEGFDLDTPGEIEGEAVVGSNLNGTSPKMGLPASGSKPDTEISVGGDKPGDSGTDSPGQVVKPPNDTTKTIAAADKAIDRIGEQNYLDETFPGQGGESGEKMPPVSNDTAAAELTEQNKLAADGKKSADKKAEKVEVLGNINKKYGAPFTVNTNGTVSMNGKVAKGYRINPVTKQPQEYLKADDKGRAMVYDDRINEWVTAEDFGRDMWGRDSNGDAEYLRTRGLGVGYGITAEEEEMFKHKDMSHMDRKQEAAMRGMTSFMESLPGAANGLFKGMFDMTSAMLSGDSVSAAGRALAIGMTGIKSVNDSITDAAHRFNVNNPHDPKLEKTLYGANRKAEVDGFNDAAAIASGVLNGKDVSNMTREELFETVDALKAAREQAASKTYTANTPEALKQQAAVKNLDNMIKGVGGAVKDMRSGDTEDQRRKNDVLKKQHSDYLGRLKKIGPALHGAVYATIGDNFKHMRGMEDINGYAIPVPNKKSTLKTMIGELDKARSKAKTTNEIYEIDRTTRACKTLYTEWEDRERVRKDELFKQNMDRHNFPVSKVLALSDGNLKSIWDPATHPTTIDKYIHMMDMELQSNKNLSPEDRKAAENFKTQLVAIRALRQSRRMDEGKHTTEAAMKMRRVAAGKLSTDSGFLADIERLSDRATAQKVANAFAGGDVNNMREATKTVNDLIQANIGGTEVFAGDAQNAFKDVNSKSKGTSGVISDMNAAAYRLSGNMGNMASENGMYAMDVSDINRAQLDKMGSAYRGVKEAVFYGSPLVYTDSGNSRSLSDSMRKSFALEAESLKKAEPPAGDPDYPEWKKKYNKAKHMNILYDRLSACDGNPELLQSHLDFTLSAFPATTANNAREPHDKMMREVYWRVRDGKNAAADDVGKWKVWKADDPLFAKMDITHNVGNTTGMSGDWFLPVDPGQAKKYMKMVQILNEERLNVAASKPTNKTTLIHPPNNASGVASALRRRNP